MHRYDLSYLRRAQRVDRFVSMLGCVIEDDETLFITDEDGPVAVIISAAEHERLLAATTKGEA